LILKETGPKKPAQLAKLIDKKSGAIRIALMRMRDKGEVILNEDGTYSFSV
jgi:predicted transcriptional regulator